MPLLDPDLYPRTYAQARNRGLSDKDADDLAHEAEQQALSGELTAAERASLETDRLFLASF